jgi:hypothetical protein
MTQDSTDPGNNGMQGVLAWLRSSVTLTLPGWALAAGGFVLVLLLLLALD